VASLRKFEGIWIRSNVVLVYGGGLGGGGGGQFGREVVRRLTGGDRSSDGAGEDDELELDNGCRSVV
jgi:hypothetical protein